MTLSHHNKASYIHHGYHYDSLVYLLDLDVTRSLVHYINQGSNRDLCPTRNDHRVHNDKHVFFSRFGTNQSVASCRGISETASRW